MTAALATAGPATTLPRAAAAKPVTVRPAPRREPPFDDELAGPPVIGAWDQPLPFDTRPVEHRHFVSLRPRGLADPGIWARRLLVGLIESAAGRRPLHQLSSMLSPAVNRGLGADFERAARSRSAHWLHRATVCSVRVCEPAEGVAELSATVDTGQRVRAVAMRLEERQGRWRCTRLQLG